LATWIERSRNHCRGWTPTSKLPTLASVWLEDELLADRCLVRSAQRCHQRSQPNCQRTKRGAIAKLSSPSLRREPTGVTFPRNMFPVCLRHLAAQG